MVDGRGPVRVRRLRVRVDGRHVAAATDAQLTATIAAQLPRSAAEPDAIAALASEVRRATRRVAGSPPSRRDRG